MNDELRNQLERLDPMHPGVPIESVTTPSSRARLEQIMNTPLVEQESANTPSEQNGVRSTILAGMSPAFAATATSVDAGSVTLTVDRWYTGDDGGLRSSLPGLTQAWLCGVEVNRPAPRLGGRDRYPGGHRERGRIQS